MGAERQVGGVKEGENNPVIKQTEKKRSEAKSNNRKEHSQMHMPVHVARISSCASEVTSVL